MKIEVEITEEEITAAAIKNVRHAVVEYVANYQTPPLITQRVKVLAPDIIDSAVTVEYLFSQLHSFSQGCHHFCGQQACGSV